MELIRFLDYLASWRLCGWWDQLIDNCGWIQTSIELKCLQNWPGYKRNQRLIGLDMACYVINTKRSRSNGNLTECRPTVYMRWSMNRCMPETIILHLFCIAATSCTWKPPIAPKKHLLHQKNTHCNWRTYCIKNYPLHLKSTYFIWKAPVSPKSTFAPFVCCNCKRNILQLFCIANTFCTCKAPRHLVISFLLQLQVQPLAFFVYCKPILHL